MTINTDGKLVFESGRILGALSDVIGLDVKSLDTLSGHDGGLSVMDSSGNVIEYDLPHEDGAMTAGERRELAAFMIQRWKDFADQEIEGPP